MVILITCSTTFSWSQSHPILNYFTTNLSDGRVLLSWEIKGGDQCNGIKVLRSTDSLHFTQIGDIAGICGSPDFAQPYTYTDESPTENAINYYKIELGGQGFASSSGVHYVKLLNDGYKVYPNPITQDSRLYFNNPGQNYTFQLIDYTGKMVMSMETGQQSEIDLSTLNVLSGPYIFQLIPQSTGEAIQGKLLVPQN